METNPELYDKAVKIIRSCTTPQHIAAAKTFINNVEDIQIKNHLYYLCDSRLESLNSQFVDNEDYFKTKWHQLQTDLPLVEAPSQEIITDLIINYCKFDIQQFSEALSSYAQLKLTVYRNFKHLLIDFYASMQGLHWDEVNDNWISKN